MWCGLTHLASSNHRCSGQQLLSMWLYAGAATAAADSVCRARLFRCMELCMGASGLGGVVHGPTLITTSNSSQPCVIKHPLSRHCKGTFQGTF
jgi:hypothetical protein